MCFLLSVHNTVFTKFQIMLNKCKNYHTICLPSSHSVGRQLVGPGTLEPDHALRLLVAVWHAVGVVADVLLGRIGQALLARRLIGHASRTLCVATQRKEKVRHS
jgi:hypothetical protein